ncbi:MAG: hypothetical protein KA444_09855, partial [Bacteroidia bacterium]|nr:hypothetical protein [Bacteroidia bacterium]
MKRISFFYFTSLFSIFILGSNIVSAQQWKPLGPDTVPALIRPKDNSLSFASGIGRVSMLRVEPGKIKKGEEPILYLGSPYGGLWQKKYSDTKWKSAGTDKLMHIGISDLAIHPKQTKIRYIVTGDPDCIMDPNGPALSSEFCQSRGIVKSVDCGETWSDTAIGKWFDHLGVYQKDFWKFPSRKIARKLLIDSKQPECLNTVIHTYNSATKSYDGMIFRTEDGGANWQTSLFVRNGFLKDLEYKPGSVKVMYTSGRGVYKSIDKGKTWFHLNSNGLPQDTLVKRIEIATAPSDPSLIYALVIYENSRNSDIYLSSDEGESFVRIVSALASPEWRTAIAVDSKNSSLVYFSAGNRVHRLYKRDSGWRQEYTGGFIHDAVHDLTFPAEGNKLYASTDGGLFASQDSGKSWTDLRAG